MEARLTKKILTVEEHLLAGQYKIRTSGGSIASWQQPGCARNSDNNGQSSILQSQNKATHASPEPGHAVSRTAHQALTPTMFGAGSSPDETEALPGANVTLGSLLPYVVHVKRSSSGYSGDGPRFASV